MKSGWDRRKTGSQDLSSKIVSVVLARHDSRLGPGDICQEGEGEEKERGTLKERRVLSTHSRFSLKRIKNPADKLDISAEKGQETETKFPDGATYR